MAGGRPTKYKKAFCKMLIDHMAEGLSFESFGGVDGVDASKQTLYDWANKHPEFLDAKRLGTQKSMIFWEKMGRAGAGGKLPGFQNSAWIFNMKNRFTWRDRTDVIHTEVKQGDRDLSDENLEAKIDEQLAKRKARRSRATKTSRNGKSARGKGKST